MMFTKKYTKFLVIIALMLSIELASEARLVVDVRTESEWKLGHLESAVHIPLQEIDQKIKLFASSKEQKILLYCGGGRRAGEAEKILKKLGYTNAVNTGGMLEVSEAFGLNVIQ